MSKKSRYILIIIGLLSFLILAPLLILYVLGYAYDIRQGNFIRTGILATRTDPKQATIRINGKVVREESGDIKFLRPGEYNISITANDYQTWNKRLPVYANEVTWANAKAPKIVLFKNIVPATKLAESVKDFYSNGSKLAVLKDSSIHVGELHNTSTLKSLAIPHKASKIIASPSGDFLLLIDNKHASPVLMVYDWETEKITDLSSLVQTGFSAQFSNSNELFLYNAGTVYKIIWKVPEKIPIFRNVSAFSIEGNDIYVAYQTPVPALATANTASLEEQILATNLPKFNHTFLHITKQRDIFVEADGILFKLNNSFEKIEENIANCQTENGVLSCIGAGELGYYVRGGQSLELVTRSNQTIFGQQIRFDPGYAIYVSGSEVIASELDTRDHQNQFVIYRGKGPKKIWTDNLAKQLVVLDEEVLFLQKIR